MAPGRCDGGRPAAPQHAGHATGRSDLSAPGQHYLHVLDERWTREHAHLGTLVRYADDFVIMCDTEESCEEAKHVVETILAELGLELHPEKTRRVELTEGKEGFDFLGCHLRKRMSGRLWEKYGRRRYYLQRWPSRKALKQVKSRVRQLVGSHRNGVRDVRGARGGAEARAPRPARRGRSRAERGGGRACGRVADRWSAASGRGGRGIPSRGSQGARALATIRREFAPDPLTGDRAAGTSSPALLFSGITLD